MRETKEEILYGVNGVQSARLVARNTVEMKMEDGRTIIRFHHTNIITFETDGAVTLSTGGWHTQTTRERMNELSPFNVWKSEGVWYVQPKGGGDASAFYSGITYREGRCTTGIKVANVDVNKLKRRIRKLANRLDAPAYGHIPMPGTGDCPHCYRAAIESVGTSGYDAKTRGTNTEHLLLHAVQGELEGSLIYAAMKDAGYRDDQVSLYYTMAKEHDSFRDRIKDAVASYLRKVLVPEQTTRAEAATA